MPIPGSWYPTPSCVVVPLELVRYGPPEHGVWCDRCLLPSAARQRLAVVSGMSILAVVDVTVCEDCGSHSKTRRPELEG